MSNLHKAVIKGSEYKISFHFHVTKDIKQHARTIKNKEFIRETVLWEGELDLPVMKRGDEIHILELDLTVKIESCLRTTENKFIYTTDHEELIKDEEFSMSRARYEKNAYFKELEEKRLAEKKALKERPWFKKIFQLS